MLQKGHFVADLLYLQAESAPNRFIPPGVDFSNPVPPDSPGYNYDGCTADVVLNRIAIKNGLICLPDGMTYKALVLPARGEQLMAGVMTVKLAKKIGELVREGMIIIGPPPLKTPGLTNYPQSEDELKDIVTNLWGENSMTGERKIGKGRVITGKTPQQVLSELGIPEDFSCGQPAHFRYTHRRGEDGTEIYFISNKQDQEVEAECSFRVSKRWPEFWWPESGLTDKPAMFSEIDGVTKLPVRLQAFESVFVIFPADSQTGPDRVVSISHNDNPMIKNFGSKIQVTKRNRKFETAIFQPGKYTLQTSNNTRHTIEIPGLPEPQRI